MLIILVVLGAVIGIMLGLIVLSFVARDAPHLPHAERPARERRPHEHIEPSSRVQRYPAVPPPLAPMTATPKVLLPSLGAAPLPPAAPFVAPVVTVEPSATHFVTPPVAPTPSPTAAPSPKKQAAFVAFDAATAIAEDDELLELLEQGHFIAALDHYRKTHHVGVDEAKAALEAWRSKSAAREQLAGSVQAALDDPDVLAAIRQGKFIEAIKVYRAKTGATLQDAKRAIDLWRKELGH